MVEHPSRVVVVGGGIIGASIAYQLTRRSDIEVTVVDKAAGPAAGSTGASAAFSRCRYTIDDVVRLARDAQQAFGDWAAFTGLAEPASTLTRLGAIWMYPFTQREAAAEVARLEGHGVAATALTAEEVGARYPLLSTCAAPFDLTGEVEHVCEDGEAFVFEDGAGYVDPSGANQDLVDATRRQGGTVRFRSEVTGIRKDGERVAGVTLADGSAIDADIVINAVGAWCNGLNALAGVAHRWTLTPTRVQTVLRPWSPSYGELPIVLDGSVNMGMRPHANGQQIMIPAAESLEHAVADPDHWNQATDWEIAQLSLAAFHHRVPSADPRGHLTGIAGLYTINEQDVHPIVGPTEVPGFWLANGFSGHGLKLAPMIGSMIARELTGVGAAFDTDVPMSLFSIEREPLDLGTKNVFA